LDIYEGTYYLTLIRGISYRIQNNKRERGMAVSIRQVTTKKDVKTYLNLPYEMHKQHELWVPPLRIFEKNFIHPKKNHHTAYSQTVCFIAFKDGKVVGRIMGIINRKLNETWGTRQGRFCSFETIEDQDVANALLGAVEQWSEQNGMKQVVGPLGFSNQDSQGFLIEGFQERPSIGTIYNFEYIPKLMENAGYQKEVDYVTYKVVIPREIPEIYEKISERVLKRSTVSIREFTKRREAKTYLPKVLRLMNETFTDIYGFIPLTEEVIKKLSRTYTEIMDPHFLKVVMNEQGEIIGFIFGIKDITEGFKRAKGRLIPFGYFQIKCTQKKSKRLDLLLGSIKKEYRGKGVDTLLGISMVKSAHKLNMEYADSHHELEDNRMIRAEMEKVGGQVYKRHRVYRKDLSPV